MIRRYWALRLLLALGMGLAGSTAASASTAMEESASGEVTEKGITNALDRLSSDGIQIGLGSTNVYQANVKNGLGTHQKSGRFTGSYDVEIAADFEKLFGLAGLGLFVHSEGGWPDTEGIDEQMVGSVSGVNADAGGNRSLDVVEVVFE